MSKHLNVTLRKLLNVKHRTFVSGSWKRLFYQWNAELGQHFRMVPFLALCFYLVCFSALFPLPFNTLCLPPSDTSHLKRNKRNTVLNARKTIHTVFLMVSLSLPLPSSSPLIASCNFIHHNLNHINNAFYQLQTGKKRLEGNTTFICLDIPCKP